MARKRNGAVLCGILAVLVACQGAGSEDDASTAPAAGHQRTTAAADTSNDGGGQLAAGNLIPASARFERVAEFPMDPTRDELPDDSMLAAAIRRGFEITRHTADEMPDYVGNRMACGNCHLNAGQRDLGLPWRGIAGLFPISRNREDRLFSLEDRIRGCFMRSMNGTKPPFDDPDLLAISAYITWLSRDIPVGESPEWRGRNTISEDARIPIDQLDPAEGGALFAQKCAACHGPDGQNTSYGPASPGPLWGAGSWNDGAGFARVYTLAGFIRYAMPLTDPGSLTDREAQQIAAFIDSRQRPSYPDKAADYPNGTPIDAVYYPRYPEHPLRGNGGEATTTRDSAAAAGAEPSP